MIHVLRTRSPVYSSLRTFSLDLHVLGTPPAFVLSQDQTLQLSLSLFSPGDTNRRFRGSSGPRLFADVLRYSLKALRFRNLLRGLAIRFSKTERPCACHSGRPTSSPASSAGARFLPLCAVPCQGHHFRPVTPRAAG